MKVFDAAEMEIAVAKKCDPDFDYSRLNLLVGENVYPDDKNFEIAHIIINGEKLYEIHFQLNAQNYLYIEAVVGKGLNTRTLFDGLNELKEKTNARGIVFVTKLAGLANQAQKFGFEIVGLYIKK